MQATVHNLFREPDIMPNNLDAVIRASGMTKKEVAQAAGVKAETLSRHIHGKVQMTLENAQKYADILNVNVQKVMFRNPPTPIAGECLVNEEGIKRTLYHTWKKGIQIPTYTVADDLCCFENRTIEGYQGFWYEYQNALTFYLKDPIVKDYVHRACVQNACMVKLKNAIKLPKQSETKIFTGVLYPEPGNVYTIDNPQFGVNFRGVELQWATPFVSALFRPDLRGVTYVDIESEVNV